jgi:hypothetical protein
MTTTRRRLFLAALVPLLVGAVACGGGGDDDDDAVASLGTDESAEADGSGSDDESGGGGENPRDSQEFQDAALEFAQCMRDNGIDMPDPEFDGEGGVQIRAGGGPGGAGGPGGGPDDEEFQAAEEECRPIMEEVAPDIQLDPEEQAERQDQMIEVAQCMRDRGHDMPDPEVDENGRVTVQAGPGQATGPAPGSGGEDEFESDMSECQEEAGMEMPDGAGGGTAGEVED